MHGVTQFSNQDLFRALLSDTMDLMSGFVLPIPIPRELIRVLYEKMKKNPVNKYLNKDYDQLIAYYKQDEDKLLSLSFNNETEFLPQLVVIDNTTEPLDVDRFRIKFNSTVFELDEGLRSTTKPAFESFIKGVKYSNEENLRLIKVEKQDNGYIFHTQPVYYKTYLHTNLLVDYEPKNKSSIRSIAHPDGQLEPLEESLLANHIGFNVLVFTPLGELIIPVRSKDVSYAPLELSASISGAVAAYDVSDGRPLQEHVIIREGLEELGLLRNEVVEDSIQFLGLTRELLRGGKPELFFAMETKLTYSEVVERWKQAKDKWENNKVIYFPFGDIARKPLLSEVDHKLFEDKTVDLFKQFGSNMSLPFVTNLALWLKLKRAGN